MRKILLVAAFTAFGTDPGLACDNPVYRYALENWDAADFLLMVAAGQAAARPELDRLTKLEPRPNLRLLDAGDDDPLRRLAADEGGELVLLAPAAERASGPVAVWSGAGPEAVARIVDSPTRRDLAARLIAGEAIVWVVVESDSAADMDRQLEKLGTLITTYIETVVSQDESLRASPPPAVPGVPTAEPIDKSAFWPPRMSILRVRADDPAEEVLVALLRSNLDEPAAGPHVFPVFGRGRVLGGMPLAKLDAAKFRSAGDFLTGACSCEVKEMNPGRDLLVAADWNSVPKVTRQPNSIALSDLEASEDPNRPPPGIVHERPGQTSPTLPAGGTAAPPAARAETRAVRAESRPAETPLAQRPAVRIAGWLAVAAATLVALAILLRGRS